MNFVPLRRLSEKSRSECKFANERVCVSDNNNTQATNVAWHTAIFLSKYSCFWLLVIVALRYGSRANAFVNMTVFHPTLFTSVFPVMVKISYNENRFLPSPNKKNRWWMRKTKIQKFVFSRKKICFLPLRGAAEQSRSKWKFAKEPTCVSGNTHTRGNPTQLIRTEPNPAQAKKNGQICDKQIGQIPVFEQKKLGFVPLRGALEESPSK